MTVALAVMPGRISTTALHRSPASAGGTVTIAGDRACRHLVTMGNLKEFL